MKILIACGGTGGHLFPALALANSLEKKLNNSDILLAVTKQNVNQTIINKKYKIKCLSFAPLHFKNIVSWLKFIKGSFESVWILIRFNPDIVVGFGGYASSVIVLLASVVNIKTIIYEPNVIAGRANRILGFFVDRVAINFSQTRNYFSQKDKILFTTSCLRDDLIKIDKPNARGYFGLDSDKFTILVTGGSQGAHKINHAFLKTINLLKDKFSFQVVHLTGISDCETVMKEYAKISLKSKVYDFLKEISYAYSAADLVISRAGATAINEIIFYNLASILIPYPYAYAHQKKNASVLVDLRLAELIEDGKLDEKSLSEKISYFLTNPQALLKIQNSFKEIFSCLNKDTLTEEVISLCTQ